MPPSDKCTKLAEWAVYSFSLFFFGAVVFLLTLPLCHSSASFPLITELRQLFSKLVFRRSSLLSVSIASMTRIVIFVEGPAVSSSAGPTDAVDRATSTDATAVMA